MAFGASSNTIEYGVHYMNIYALGTIFVELTLGMNAFITAQGFAKNRNAFRADWRGFQYYFWIRSSFLGFDMDVRGACPWLPLVSQALSCIWVVRFLCGKKTYLKIRKQNLRLTPSIIMPCLALGIATFIMQASESVISVCFNSSLQKYGGDIAVGRNDDSDKCDAVCHASAAGTGTGGAAYYQLLLWREGYRTGQGSI